MPGEAPTTDYSTRPLTGLGSPRIALTMKLPRRRYLIALVLVSAAVWPVLAGLDWLYREPENYSLIEDGLYMGGLTQQPPPGTRAVLNLCELEDSYQCDYYRWAPIPDRAPAPKLEWLERQIAYVGTHRNAGQTTYVHCAQGVSRSGMVITAYMMKKHSWTRDEAIAKIRAKRPVLRPNPAFMELLSEWEKQLAK